MRPDTATQFEKLEETLQALRARVPDLPFTEILLCRLLLQMGRQISISLERKMRPFGLAEAEFSVLTTLYSQPDGAHPSDLCASTARGAANMSRICDSLVTRELITRVRSARDRRRIVLRITEQGADLVWRVLPKVYVSQREMITAFQESEQRLLISQLKRLRST